jgi:hypothetical protein
MLLVHEDDREALREKIDRLSPVQSVCEEEHRAYGPEMDMSIGLPGPIAEFSTIEGNLVKGCPLDGILLNVNWPKRENEFVPNNLSVINGRFLN